MKMPVLFISHGGGPWPWVEDMRSHFQKTEVELKNLGRVLRPKAILSVSGHWEEDDFTVATASHPGMIYDYSGFPPHTYNIKYEAPGAPEISLKARKLLMEAGFQVKEDPSQGYDHGTFVPLYLMYPEGDIPIAQLSLRHSLNPEEHIRAGEALQPLRSEGVLIIGSGLSYHNLRAFFRGGKDPSEAFEGWLTETIAKPEKERKEALVHWEKAPSARAAHPREDHLIPLMVVAGAAGHDSGKRLFLDNAFGVAMASYQFGQLES